MKQTLSSATSGSWLVPDVALNPFNLGIGCVCSSNINATYSVQYSHDSPLDSVTCSISRSSTTATLTLTNHGLTTNDSIVVSGTGDSNLDGTYGVAGVTNQNVITYTVADTGATAAVGKVSVMRVFNHPTLVSKTASADGNIAYPVRAVRLTITSYTAGYVTMLVSQAGL